MSITERARAAKRLRDDETFRDVITEIEAGLSKTFLNAATSDEDVAEARRTVAGLAAIKREIQRRIDAPKLASSKKGQHRGSD